MRVYMLQREFDNSKRAFHFLPLNYLVPTIYLVPSAHVHVQIRLNSYNRRCKLFKQHVTRLRFVGQHNECIDEKQGGRPYTLI